MGLPTSGTVVASVCVAAMRSDISARVRGSSCGAVYGGGSAVIRRVEDAD